MTFDATSQLALLSTRVYARRDVNRGPMPLDWQELSWLPDSLTGFSAGVYRGSSDPNRIVIAFTGTNDHTIADSVSANMPAAIGLPSPQVIAAIDLVRRTMKEHPSAEISFTGHSLGGGLASLMAVYFGRPATIFAPAPFEQSATTALTVFAYYTQYLAGVMGNGGSVSPAFSAFAAAPAALFASREAAVAAISVQGEFLSTWPGFAQTPKIVGSLAVLDPGTTAVGAVDLHSMSLHAAMLLSPDFRMAVVQTPALLPALFDRRLYYRDSQFDARRNLLDHLLRHEVGVPGSFGASAALTHFTQDLVKLGDATGDASSKVSGLVAVLLQHYYDMADGFTSEVFAVIPGGLRFDRPTGDGVGLARFADELQATSGAGDRMAVAGLAQTSQAFFVQWGANPLTATASIGSDAMLGGGGVDNLDGAAGSDLLIGVAGDDTLIGGGGSDYLLGGSGNDSYIFEPGHLHDTIVDADGIGRLVFRNGNTDAQLTGGNRLTDNTYLSDPIDGVRYGLTRTEIKDETGAVIRADLIVTKGSSPDRITIRGWQQGQLGITLSETPAQFAVAEAQQVAPTDAESYWLYGDVAGPDVRDELIGRSGNDLLHGYLGDDLLEGGDNGDILVGGLGADRIIGGAGTDAIHGGGHTPGVLRGAEQPPAGQAFVWLNDGPNWFAGLTTEGTLAVGGALFGYTAEAGGANDADAGDFIDAGDGHDWVLGDAGDDLIELGAGNDIAYGGQGGDVIAGGSGNDSIRGDYINFDTYVFVPSEHGNDVLLGDAGADRIEGFGGDDELYGGADDDVLWGDDTFDLPATYHGHDLLDGGSGDDRLSGQGGDDELHGGTGDDVLVGDDTAARLTGEHHGADHLDGDDGADELQGQGGADTLFGGAGNDVLFGDDVTAVLAGQFHGADSLDGEDGDDYLEGQGGADELFGGEGADTLFGDSTAVQVDPAVHGDDLLDGEGGDDWLIGGGGRDTLFGGAGNDQLQGDDVESNLPSALHGDDTLDGEDGDDLLAGQGGADALYGGDGNDTLIGDGIASEVAAGAHGDDFLDGGAGVDTLVGGGGDDLLYGGEGNDALNGDDAVARVDAAAHGSDTLHGDAGDDLLTGAGGNDHLFGGAGNDTLHGDAADVPESAHGADILDGGDGHDALVGGGRADMLYGGDGDDTLIGDDAQASLGVSAHGDDLLDSGAGVDILVGGGGADTLDGGTEDDTLWGDGSPLNTVADEAHGSDLLAGGDGNDGLIGGGGADTLRGGAGDDRLWGDGYSGQAGTLTVEAAFQGADVLDGGPGDDVLSGGGGADVYVFAAGDGNDRIVDGGGSPDANRIRLASANPGEVRLAQAGGDLVVSYGSGTDSITVEGHFSSSNPHIADIEFADGTTWGSERILDEVYRATAISGGPGSDTLYGTAGNDLIRAADGDDILSGGGGADRLHGEAGNDVLYGDDGDDTLDGGTGWNRLYGGANADTYRVEATATNEVEARNWMGQVSGVAEDTLVFGPGVRPQNLAFSHEPYQRYVPGSGTYETSDGSLFIRIVDARSGLFRGSVRIESFFAGAPDYNGGIRELRFTDEPGLAWTGSQLRALALTGGVGTDIISATGRDDVLAGGGGDDLLYGGSGSDRIEGGAGDDRLDGGAGDDVFVYARGDGSDEIVDASGSDALEFGAGIVPSELVLSRTSPGDGVESADSLVVQFGSSDTQIRIPEYFLAGGRIEQIRFAGGPTWTDADVLARAVDRRGAPDDKPGTAGDDLYEVDHAGDRIFEQSGGGFDRVVSSASYTLPAEVEELTLSGTLNLNANGNERDNLIRGNDGANVLSGGEGRDTLIGGRGDDRYVLSGNSSGDVGDTVVEAAGEGVDMVLVDNWTYTLPDNVEHLTASGLGAYFSRVNDPLDPVFGWRGEPRAFSVQAAFRGNAGANHIDANAVPAHRITDANARGNILIDGGAGADVLAGSLANDTYVIDDAGDRIVEPGARDDGTQISTGDGIVTPFAVSLLTGHPDMERVELVGTHPVAAEGNGADNVMIASGNPAANVLAGGAGNDVYVVDESDAVVEAAGGGADTVFIDVEATARSRTTYGLSAYAFVENLAATGRTGSVVLIGDAGDNALTGSGGSAAAGLGDDRLDGGAGNDILRDAWFGDSGYAGPDVDELLGGDGDDRLESEWGEDILDGGAGDDVYALGAYSEAAVVFGAGSGMDAVERASASQKQVRWTASTDLAGLRVTRAGRDAVITLQGQADSLRLLDFFDGTGAIVSSIDRWQLADGSVLTREAIAAAIDAADRATATDGADLLVTAAHGGAVDGGAGDDWLVGQGGDDHLLGASGADRLFGGNGDDALTGGAGDDVLRGGRGADIYRVDAGSGRDTIEDDRDEAAPDETVDAIVFDAGVTPGSVTIGLADHGLYVSWDGNGIEVRGFRSTAGDRSGTVEEIRFADGTVWDHAELVRRAYSIYGTAGDDYLEVTAGGGMQVYGLAGNDSLRGGSGNDLLDGGAGGDSMAGRGGDDIYVVDSTADVVTEVADEGTDTVISSVTRTLGSHQENLTLAGAAAINGTGNSLANVLVGNGAGNTLNGGSGADRMAGGSGNDTYVVDHAGDVVTENADDGTDVVQSSVGYTLGAHVENLTLTGSAAIHGTGNALANVITGNGGANTLAGGDGDDTLDGGAGSDTMLGGAGNDTYVVGASGDVVTENPGEGIDLVRSAVTYTLGAHVENLTLTGTSSIGGTGNGLDNVLTGNGAANTLTGGAGNDYLDGGSGSDTMRGGTGDDTYVVNVSTDVVTESAGEGSDTVRSSVSLTLAANVEHLVLTGTGAVNGTGNALANHLRGNDAANALNGSGGNDVLQGGAGNDTLTDSSGNNVVDGGPGTDSLNGGTGREFVAGGAGNDTLKLGGGADVIAFNRGHGADSLSAPTSGAGLGELNDTVSLGGVRYGDLRLARSGSDLVLKMAGSTDSLRFAGWYSASGNRTVTALQLIVDSTADYDPGSADRLLNRRVVRLDFGVLVGAFNTAYAANPAVGDWAVPPATLASAYAAGSDTQAVGGALAYAYGRDGNLAALDFAAAAAVLGDAGFATTAQAIGTSTTGGVRLLGELPGASKAAATASGAPGSGDAYLSFDAWALAAEAEAGVEEIAEEPASVAGGFDAPGNAPPGAFPGDAELLSAAAVAGRWEGVDKALQRLGREGTRLFGDGAFALRAPDEDFLGLDPAAMTNLALARPPRDHRVAL